MYSFILFIYLFFLWGGEGRVLTQGALWFRENGERKV